MNFTKLGSSGTVVSKIALGTMYFGDETSQERRLPFLTRSSKRAVISSIPPTFMREALQSRLSAAALPNHGQRR